MSKTESTQSERAAKALADKNRLIEGLGTVFTMARIHQMSTNPGDEAALLELIRFRQEIFKRLDIDDVDNKKTNGQ